MEREAKRRRFFEANAKAFLGDGLPWNWSIWKKHFLDFTPILDFIHVLSYLFLAAKAVHDAPEDAWSQQFRLDARCLARGGGAGAGGIAGLASWGRGVPDKDTPDSDPRQILATTITYLENNQDRNEVP